MVAVTVVVTVAIAVQFPLTVAVAHVCRECVCVCEFMSVCGFKKNVFVFKNKILKL